MAEGGLLFNAINEFLSEGVLLLKRKQSRNWILARIQSG